MNTRPKIFISSTIYDFKYLRSSLKYWFEELGYNVQLSEFNDFKKDLDKGTLVVLPQTDLKISRAVKNIPKIKTIRADSLNVLDILNHRYLLILQDSIEVIKKTYIK